MKLERTSELKISGNAFTHSIYTSECGPIVRCDVFEGVINEVDPSVIKCERHVDGDTFCSFIVDGKKKFDVAFHDYSYDRAKKMMLSMVRTIAWLKLSKHKKHLKRKAASLSMWSY